MRRLFRLVLLAALASPLVALAYPAPLVDSPPLITCPWVDASDAYTFDQQGFYVARYPGNTLSKVTLYLKFPLNGTYGLSLTARAGSFNGTVLGTATATVTAVAGEFVPVEFPYASPGVTPQTAVTFQGAIVSGPGSAGSILFSYQTTAGCPLVVTSRATTPPLDTYLVGGAAVLIEGASATPGFTVQTMTIPSVASIHGANGTFYHTDIWLTNRDNNNDITVTARFRCLTGQSCSNTTSTFSMPRAIVHATTTITDVVPALFGLTETAGALELTYTAATPDALLAVSRTYSPALPAATTGASLVALPASAATGISVYVGIAGSGGNLATGFRTNAGAYNPQEVSASVDFELVSPDGTSIGTTSLTLAPHEARQINDIFASVGHGSLVMTDAELLVVSNVPIFSFATVIDNRTADFVYQATTKLY